MMNKGMAEYASNRNYPIMATIPEAAQIFNVSQWFLRSNCRRGAEWSVRAGRRYLINCDLLARFLSGGGSENAQNTR